MLELKNISVQLGGKSILSNISLSLLSGNILMVIGPNGCGKTTLIRAVMNALHYNGNALLAGKDMKKIKPCDIAKGIGVLTQNNNIAFEFNCYELVSVGRYAHKKTWVTGLRDDDKKAIDMAFELTRTSHLKNRLVTTLSGGELQRVCLARTFAQQPHILILDEPTNHLDIEHQFLIFNIIKDWVQEENRAVLSIIHDLNLAYSYGTHALLMSEGHQIAFGTPKEVLTSDNLKQVYNVDIMAWMQSLLEKWQYE